MRAEHPSISDVDLVEGVFGAKEKGKILGMGPVLASQVRGPAPSKKELRLGMQQRLNNMEETLRQEREDRNRENEERRQEKEVRRKKKEDDRNQMMSMMTQYFGAGGASSFDPAMFGGASSFDPYMFAQLYSNPGHSAGGSSSAIPPPVQPEQDYYRPVQLEQNF